MFVGVSEKSTWFCDCSHFSQVVFSNSFCCMRIFAKLSVSASHSDSPFFDKSKRVRLHFLHCCTFILLLSKKGISDGTFREPLRRGKIGSKRVENFLFRRRR